MQYPATVPENNRDLWYKTHRIPTTNCQDVFHKEWHFVYHLEACNVNFKHTKRGVKHSNNVTT